MNIDLLPDKVCAAYAAQIAMKQYPCRPSLVQGHAGYTLHIGKDGFNKRHSCTIPRRMTVHLRVLDIVANARLGQWRRINHHLQFGKVAVSDPRQHRPARVPRANRKSKPPRGIHKTLQNTLTVIQGPAHVVKRPDTALVVIQTHPHVAETGEPTTGRATYVFKWDQTQGRLCYCLCVFLSWAFCHHRRSRVDVDRLSAKAQAACLCDRSGPRTIAGLVDLLGYWFAMRGRGHFQCAAKACGTLTKAKAPPRPATCVW